MRRFLLLVVAASALASPAAAYRRTTDAVSGQCAFWPRRVLPWLLNQKGSADVPLDRLERALQASFAVWTDVECSDLAFRYDGRTTRIDVGYDRTRADNVNVIVFREQLCAVTAPVDDPCFEERNCNDLYDCWQHSAGVLAMTSVSFSKSTGVVFDADIEFNGSPDANGFELRFTATDAEGPPCARPGDPDCVSSDVQNTAAHEIGHFIGFAHSSEVDATMFGQATPGETGKRSLSGDDEEAVCAVYPQGAAPATCTPSGHITFVAAAPAPGCGCASGAEPSPLLLGLLAIALRSRRSAHGSG